MAIGWTSRRTSSERKAVFEGIEGGRGRPQSATSRSPKELRKVGMEHFVYEDRERLRDYIDPDVARQARGLSLLGSMQGHVEDYFDHPKLQPDHAVRWCFWAVRRPTRPRCTTLMSHVDFNLGVWYPDGGIGAVIDGVAELGAELGVEYDTDRPPRRSRDARAGSRSKPKRGRYRRIWS